MQRSSGKSKSKPSTHYDRASGVVSPTQEEEMWLRENRTRLSGIRHAPPSALVANTRVLDAPNTRGGAAGGGTKQQRKNAGKRTQSGYRSDTSGSVRREVKAYDRFSARQYHHHREGREIVSSGVAHPHNNNSTGGRHYSCSSSTASDTNSDLSYSSSTSYSSGSDDYSSDEEMSPAVRTTNVQRVKQQLGISSPPTARDDERRGRRRVEEVHRSPDSVEGIAVASERRRHAPAPHEKVSSPSLTVVRGDRVDEPNVMATVQGGGPSISPTRKTGRRMVNDHPSLKTSLKPFAVDDDDNDGFVARETERSATRDKKKSHGDTAVVDKMGLHKPITASDSKKKYRHGEEEDLVTVPSELQQVLVSARSQQRQHQQPQQQDLSELTGILQQLVAQQAAQLSVVSRQSPPPAAVIHQDHHRHRHRHDQGDHADEQYRSQQHQPQQQQQQQQQQHRHHDIHQKDVFMSPPGQKTPSRTEILQYTSPQALQTNNTAEYVTYVVTGGGSSSHKSPPRRDAPAAPIAMLEEVKPTSHHSRERKTKHHTSSADIFVSPNAPRLANIKTTALSPPTMEDKRTSPFVFAAAENQSSGYPQPTQNLPPSAVLSSNNNISNGVVDSPQNIAANPQASATTTRAQQSGHTQSHQRPAAAVAAPPAGLNEDPAASAEQRSRSATVATPDPFLSGRSTPSEFRRILNVGEVSLTPAAVSSTTAPPLGESASVVTMSTEQFQRIVECLESQRVRLLYRTNEPPPPPPPQQPAAAAAPLSVQQRVPSSMSPNSLMIRRSNSARVGQAPPLMRPADASSPTKKLFVAPSATAAARQLTQTQQSNVSQRADSPAPSSNTAVPPSQEQHASSERRSITPSRIPVPTRRPHATTPPLEERRRDQEQALASTSSVSFVAAPDTRVVPATLAAAVMPPPVQPVYTCVDLLPAAASRPSNTSFGPVVSSLNNSQTSSHQSQQEATSNGLVFPPSRSSPTRASSSRVVTTAPPPPLHRADSPTPVRISAEYAPPAAGRESPRGAVSFRPVASVPPAPPPRETDSLSPRRPPPPPGSRPRDGSAQRLNIFRAPQE